MRRFDAVVGIHPAETRTWPLQVLKNRLGSLKPKKVNWAAVQQAGRGLSHAEIARACENIVKNAILGHARR